VIRHLLNLAQLLVEHADVARTGVLGHQQAGHLGAVEAGRDGAQSPQAQARCQQQDEGGQGKVMMAFGQDVDSSAGWFVPPGPPAAHNARL